MAGTELIEEFFMDAYTPIKGKCRFWREAPEMDDLYNTAIKKDDKRVVCTCFVEGDMWVVPTKDTPSDCPKHRMCRYYIKTG
ncbi:MAG: hypothetical protein Q8S43_03810 [Actinomycetota bacterium]|nr:MAG: hypothetical protein FD171_2185 [Actinomycetota bacterium]MDO8950675.1 hypothetical protein [Actinomycetota bacterium]MDP3630062.1 hypothetical protein [Actinomycetota bacterium]